MKLEPKPVLEDLRQELHELEVEKAKLADKKQDKKTLNKINDADNKITKTQELIDEMVTLESTHPEGIYLSGALLMFAGKNLTTYMGLHQMSIVTSYQTTICNLL